MAASLVSGAPTAQASPVPWNWLTVSVPFSAPAAAVTTGTAQCPVDWVPISGGVAPNGSANQSYETWTINQYAVDGLVSNGRWQTTVQTSAGSTRSLVEFVHCIPASQLPSYTKVTAVLPINPALPNNHAEGTVSCPANTVAVAGGVDWDNFTTRRVEFSGPTAGGDGWYAIGTDSVNTANLYVEAYCLDINDVPGVQLAQHEYHNTGSVNEAAEATATCPSGTRVLSGGTEVHFWGSDNFPGYTFASWPTLNAWHATAYGSTPEYVYVRALCVAAGSPTIEFTVATPSPNGTQTTATDAFFSMSWSDPAGSTSASFHCALDNAALAVCPSSVGYNSLADGTHTFIAYSQTPDNRTSSLATHTWAVDTTPPKVTLGALSRVMLGSTARQSWTGSDAVSGVQSYAVRYRRAAYNAKLSAWQYPTTWSHLTSTSVSKSLALGDTVCFSVSAIDNLGNQSGWTPQHCTARPLDDRALSLATSGWKRITGSAYWLSTATQTSSHYARLSRTGAVLDRVGIVATRCSTCGQVAIYVGSVKIGSINLYRSKTQNRAVLLLPAGAARIGKVVIKVISSAKRVAIDGLVITKSA